MMVPIPQGSQSRAELRTGTKYLYPRPKEVPLGEGRVERKEDSEVGGSQPSGIGEN